jgi:exonuclease III
MVRWTFWDYKFERWPKDKGMRLDHFLLSPKGADRLVDGGVDRWARGQVNASDHAPTCLSIHTAHVDNAAEFLLSRMSGKMSLHML